MGGLSQVRKPHVLAGLCACILGALGWGFGLQPVGYQFSSERFPGFESSRLSLERQSVPEANPPSLESDANPRNRKAKDPIDLLEQSFKVHRAFAISS